MYTNPFKKDKILYYKNAYLDYDWLNRLAWFDIYTGYFICYADDENAIELLDKISIA